jgi:hypothetical protein
MSILQVIKMAHSVELSDETYEVLSKIAKDEGRSVTKQIEIWAKKVEQKRAIKEEYNRLASHEAYLEALEQAKRGEVIRVGTFKTLEELDEKLGI